MNAKENIKTWHAEFIIHKNIVAQLNDFLEWPDIWQSQPTLSCFEIEGTDNWLVEIFTDFSPTDGDAENIRHFLSQLISQPLGVLKFAGIKEKNWVSESQKQHSPIKIGRFLCHASHHTDIEEFIDDKTISIEMDAGQAFGTGGHETTGGCLQAINDFEGKISPSNILDLGTGTGLLAIAAHKIWQVPTLATDNDPKAIEVARENLAKNNISEVALSKPNGISLLLSEGFASKQFLEAGKFDLIIANILANPLIALAPELKQYTTKNCTIILSGILNNQADKVIKAYKKQDISLNEQLIFKDWSVLIFS